MLKPSGVYRSRFVWRLLTSTTLFRKESRGFHSKFTFWPLEERINVHIIWSNNVIIVTLTMTLFLVQGEMFRVVQEVSWDLPVQWCKRHNISKQHIEYWVGWATRAENQIKFFSRQLRSWGCSEHRQLTGQRVRIWVNNMNPWNQRVLCQHIRLVAIE